MLLIFVRRVSFFKILNLFFVDCQPSGVFDELLEDPPLGKRTLFSHTTLTTYYHQIGLLADTSTRISLSLSQPYIEAERSTEP